jgi:hypothetical protein
MSALFSLIPIRLVLAVVAVTLLVLQFLFGVVVDFVLGVLFVLLVLAAFALGRSTAPRS